MIVTPAAINSSFFVCLTIRLTSASSVRLLMPRISCGLSTSKRFDRQLPPAVDGDQIGQVVLALRVLRRDPAQGVEQRRQVEGIDAAVDFPNLAHLRGGVALLHDPGNPPLRPDDSAVAVGAFDDGRDNGRRRASALMGLDEATQGSARQERNITRQKDQRTPLCR